MSSPPDGQKCLWDDCTTVCADAELLYIHLCSDHIGRKSTGNLCLTCKWRDCGTTCAKRDHITSHLRVHTPLKPHICEICQKSFKRPQDLKKHEKIHTEEHHAQHKHSKAITVQDPSFSQRVRAPTQGPSSTDGNPAYRRKNSTASPSSQEEALTPNSSRPSPPIAHIHSGTGYNPYALPTWETMQDSGYGAGNKRSRDGSYDVSVDDFFHDMKRRRFTPTYDAHMAERLSALSTAAFSQHLAAAQLAHSQQQQQQQQQQQHHPMSLSHLNMSHPHPASIPPSFPNLASLPGTVEELAIVNNFLIRLGEEIANGGAGGGATTAPYSAAAVAAGGANLFDIAQLAQLGLAGLPLPLPGLGGLGGAAPNFTGNPYHAFMNPYANNGQNVNANAGGARSHVGGYPSMYNPGLDIPTRPPTASNNSPTTPHPYDDRQQQQQQQQHLGVPGLGPTHGSLRSSPTTNTQTHGHGHGHGHGSRHSSRSSVSSSSSSPAHHSSPSTKSSPILPASPPASNRDGFLGIVDGAANFDFEAAFNGVGHVPSLGGFEGSGGKVSLRSIPRLQAAAGTTEIVVAPQRRVGDGSMDVDDEEEEEEEEEHDDDGAHTPRTSLSPLAAYEHAPKPRPMEPKFSSYAPRGPSPTFNSQPSPKRGTSLPSSEDPTLKLPALSQPTSSSSSPSFSTSSFDSSSDISPRPVLPGFSTLASSLDLSPSSSSASITSYSHLDSERERLARAMGRIDIRGSPSAPGSPIPRSASVLSSASSSTTTSAKANANVKAPKISEAERRAHVELIQRLLVYVNTEFAKKEKDTGRGKSSPLGKMEEDVDVEMGSRSGSEVSDEEEEDELEEPEYDDDDGEEEGDDDDEEEEENERARFGGRSAPIPPPAPVTMRWRPVVTA